jgi:hypothetical protein
VPGAPVVVGEPPSQQIPENDGQPTR